MRDELARVLCYPKIMTRMAFHNVTALHVLAQFDGQATLVDTAPPRKRRLQGSGRPEVH